MRFDNQVVMITGAAGSLGKAVAAGFAAGGARLALADVSEAVLQQAYPGTADTRLLLPANLLDSASAQNAVNAAMQKFGRLDALCNITRHQGKLKSPACGLTRLQDSPAHCRLLQ